MNLQQVREFSLSLPEATEEPHFAYTSFRVGGKIFATVPPEETHLHVFVDEALRIPLVAAKPKVFEDLHWGAKIVGIRILLKRAPANTVFELLVEAWKRKAPKRLVSQFTDPCLGER